MRDARPPFGAAFFACPRFMDTDTSSPLAAWCPMGSTLTTFTGARLLRRSHPEGQEAGRSSGAGADQVRASDQHEGREGARPGYPANAARPRRRDDRIATLFAAVHVLSTTGAGKEPLMADAMEPFGQDMKKETADEFVGRQRHTEHACNVHRRVARPPRDSRLER